MATNTGDGFRRGAVRGRTQFKRPDGLWQKRDEHTGSLWRSRTTASRLRAQPRSLTDGTRKTHRPPGGVHSISHTQHLVTLARLMRVVRKVKKACFRAPDSDYFCRHGEAALFGLPVQDADDLEGQIGPRVTLNEVS